MYGLFLRALQGYYVATFGEEAWVRMLLQAGLPIDGFEPLVAYDATRFRAVTGAAAQALGRPAEVILEDLGTFIVTNPAYTAPRRLLRFCGRSFPEFLLSLEELPDRARLALPDMDVPPIRLTHRGPGAYALHWEAEIPDLIHILLGMLRAMADDYGALVFIEGETAPDGRQALSIRLAATRFASGRRFDLAQAG